MREVDNRLNASWQLVSQFVSWDFCRYMCEESNSQPSQTDVWTFLRNMVVARTDKQPTDITKHEIVAQFIMEARTIQSKSRMQCISDLSEAVIKICPELKTPMDKLLHHLENLLNVLDWNEDTQKDEIILARILQSVNEFTIEACKLLPLPDLLQIVTSELQPQVRKAKQKSVLNTDLYQQVVTCLQEEKINTFEATKIALALYEDKILEQIINSVETDSSQSSFQLRLTNLDQSQQLSSQQHSPEKSQLDSAGLFSLAPVYPSRNFSQLTLGSQSFSQNTLDPSEQFKVIEGIQNLDEFNPLESFLFKPKNPEPLFTVSPQRNRSRRFSPLANSPRNEQLRLSSSENSPRNERRRSSPLVNTSPKTKRLKHSPKNKKRRIASSPESNASNDGRAISPEFHTAPEEPFDSRFLQEDSNSSDFSGGKVGRKRVHQIESDLDLSDPEVECRWDNPQRTSTNQRKSANERVSNFFVHENSGSDTSDCDAHLNIRFLTPTIYKTGQLEHDPPGTNNVAWSSDNETHSSSVRTEPPSSQHNSDPSFRPSSISTATTDRSLPKPRTKTKSTAKKTKKLPTESPQFVSKTPTQPTLKGFGFSSTTSKQTEVAKKKVVEKKRLFDNDMVPNIANESALFQKPSVKTKSKTNKKIEGLGNKRKCAECKKTFRTPALLKKHVFLEHVTEDYLSTEEFM